MTRRDYLLILLLMALIVYAIVTEAQPTRHWMILYGGSNGLNFYCTDHMPYSLTGRMVWDEQLGAIELEGARGRLEAQVIEVAECNLDNIYSHRGQYYAWRFTHHQTDEHPHHRHITRGAWWINFTGQRGIE